MSTVWSIVLFVAFTSAAAILALLVPAARQARSLKVKASALLIEIESLSRDLLDDSRNLAQRIKSFK